ncbi:MAG TPA: NYN domain-containing protein, partial [Candidatus Kapabacteria bacterium]
HNVMSTEHKNSADMRLCIDALEVLYTRPEIRTVVLVAGDRDYIPLVQHMRRQGRNVFVCSFRSNVSGDLLQNIESGHFIDAFELLNEEERRELELSRKLVDARQTGMVGRMPRKLGWQQITPDTQAPIIPAPTPAVAGPAIASGTEHAADPSTRLRPAILPTPSTNGTAIHGTAINGITAPAINGTTAFAIPAPNAASVSKEKTVPMVPITDPMTKRALEIMLHHFGQHPEVWMSPLLWKLSNELPLLADFERKVLIANLESTGAIRMVKRQGTPYDYTVVLINYNHPTVRSCVP